MKYFITGGAGFIGSNLAHHLTKCGEEVVVYDNFSTGKARNLPTGTKIIVGDILDTDTLREAMAGCDFVFHLSANADVRYGLSHTDRDLRQNTLGTYEVLEAMRNNGIKNIAFSSTGSVYGEPNVIPTPEDAPFPVQTSLYGASKLACEGMIHAYSYGFGIQSYIFRFVSILGKNYSHGHVIDFFKALRKNPKKLKILGDGTQNKSYLDVEDCINGMMFGINHGSDLINIFNLGNNHSIEVKHSAEIISDSLGLNPEYYFGTQKRGWVGDSPHILLDCSKIRGCGWKPKYNIEESIIRTVDYLKSVEI